MQSDELTTQQAFALTDELESATKLVDLGVAELHKLSLANNYYHLPMQLLGQGLERFLKLTYAMAELSETGTLPTRDRMRQSFGHDLVALTEALLKRVKRAKEYVNRPVVREDLEFMRSDQDLRQILTVLSEFGQQGRYHRLDEFLDPNAVDDDADPYRRWEELESAIARRQPVWLERIGSHQGAEELQRGTSAYMAHVIDRFARAIARMWTLGPLPEEARRFMGLVKSFLFLRDEALGVPR